MVDRSIIGMLEESVVWSAKRWCYLNKKYCLFCYH